MQRIKILGRLALCALLVCVLLAGCGNGAETDDQSQKPDAAQGENTAGDPAARDTEKRRIETPVGTLSLPEEWPDGIKMQDSSADGQYAMSFYGTVGQEDVLLFELSVGAKEGSYQLGSAPDADGNRQAVWLNISEIEPKPEWTEADVTQINTMQECVNELIYQLHQLDGFQAAS